ncbi:MAG: hypothetical protein K2G27_00230 [Duncaniella sp.]|nr:hypothetical protein [Duncaniella sp.]
MNGKRYSRINRGLRQDGIQMMGRCLVYNINFPSVTLAALPEAVRVQVEETVSQRQAAYKRLLEQYHKALRDTERVARQLDRAIHTQTRIPERVLVDNLLFQVENLTALAKRLYPRQEECGVRNKI